MSADKFIGYTWSIVGSLFWSILAVSLLMCFTGGFALGTLISKKIIGK